MGHTKSFFKSGQIALPFILLISGIVVEIAIAGTFVVYFLSNSGLGDRLAIRASALAQSAIQDVMGRLSEDKEYAAAPLQYSLTLGSDVAVVSVSRSLNAQANAYVYTITVVATAGSRQKKFIATVTADQTTGTTALQSIVEVSVT